MPDVLTVRAYNVRFGDAILITVPDRGEGGEITTRRILIDVGNVLTGTGGVDEVFEPVIDDILAQLDGNPLDLYVMTHEHLDHVQGLLWAKEKRGLVLDANNAWLTRSADPDYYDDFPDAREKRLQLLETYRRIALHFDGSPGDLDARLHALLLNNNPRSTRACVDHLRTITDSPIYVSRETDLVGAHPFTEAELELWAPEEDTSTYYGRFTPMGLAASGVDPDTLLQPEADTEPGVAPMPEPPPGVDGGAFYDLVARRRRGIRDNLLQIDKAANETSIVFHLRWRGWNLLFAGDAEERSWKEMNKRALLRPVHFLKIGHHGSHNGTPSEELLDLVLPVPAPDDRPRSALVSTCAGTYNGVPDGHTLQAITDRGVEISRIGAADDPLFVELEFPDIDG